MMRALAKNVCDSTTVQWSAAMTVLGIALAVASHYGVLGPDWDKYGWAIVSAGLLQGAGRAAGLLKGRDQK